MKYKLSIVLVLILTFICLAKAEKKKRPKTFGNVVVAEVTSIYDGDTFRCNIKEYPAIIGKRIPVKV